MNKAIIALLIITIGCIIGSCNQSPAKKPGIEENKAKTDGYREQHRPQFHFSPEKMWMNDPNGMVFFEGEYHLFYQYYPDSTVWGPMHWGHAVSRDLAHWEHLPVALYPDSLGYIFSGSAVVDWNNTSGFGQGGKPPLVAIFTQHLMEGEKAGRNDFQYQSIAYSNDRGRTWTKYAGNPVIPNPTSIRDFRDPKVIWDATSAQWVLVLAAGDHVKLYGSPDLKRWTHLSDFGREWGAHGGVWECPDLFPMTVDKSGGDLKSPPDARQKWVLLLSINPGAPNGGSGTQYFIGDFDGKNFTLDASFAGSVKNEQGVWLDYGRDNYAGVTWSDVPVKDGRRLFMGWMSNWDYAQVVPTQTWRSAMTLPRSLTLTNTPEGLRLHSAPVREMETLRGKSAQIPTGAVNGNLDLSSLTGEKATTKEIFLELAWDGQQPMQDFGIELFNSKGEKVAAGFDPAKQQLFIDRTKSGKTDFSPKFPSRDVAPYSPRGNRLRLHFFIDAASVELFADDGACMMTSIFFPNEDFTGLRLFGNVNVTSGEVWELKKIWASASGNR